MTEERRSEMSDTYNFGPTVPALFAAHERRYQEALTVIALRDAEVAELKQAMKMQATGNYDYQEELKQERDKLRGQVTLLRDELNTIYKLVPDLVVLMNPSALAATEPK